MSSVYPVNIFRVSYENGFDALVIDGTYFDKILSDFWTPHLKAYDSILTAEKYETSKPIIKKALAQ